MEPWDGPACVAFTDGDVIGAVLDRNGLRPSRYSVTEDGLVVLASETGVLDLDPATVVRRGRLQPGRIFLVDTQQGRIIPDDEVKSALAEEQPYADWLHAGLLHLDDLAEREHVVYPHESVLRRQQTFGYTEEELRILLTPMARNGLEPIGSMGTDTPVAVLSDRPRLLFDYFAQLFAQVTNPPLDAIREELVTSLQTTIGPEGNLLNPTPASCRQIVMPFPVIDNDDLAKIVHVNDDGDLPGFRSVVVKGLFEVAHGRRRPARRAGAGPGAGHGRDRQRRAPDRAVRPRLGQGLGADPVVAAHLGGAPPPDPREDAHQGRSHRRGRRRARGAPRRAARRVRRRRGQPLPRHGDGRGPGQQRRDARPDAGQGRQEPHQGARQGRPQGDVQDGRVHGGVVHRRADLRGARARPGPGRRVLHRHDQPPRRGRPRPARPRGRRAAPARLPGDPAGAPAAVGRRGVPVAARGRAAPVQPADRVQAPALDAHPPLRRLQGVHPGGGRPVRAADDAARAVPAQGG